MIPADSQSAHEAAVRQEFERWCQQNCSPGAASSEWYWTIWKAGCASRAANLADAALVAEQALRELADLMEAVRTGDYVPDGFTTQPARLALLAIAQARKGE